MGHLWQTQNQTSQTKHDFAEIQPNQQQFNKTKNSNGLSTAINKMRPNSNHKSIIIHYFGSYYQKKCIGTFIQWRCFHWFSYVKGWDQDTVTVGPARTFGRPFSCVAIDLRSVAFSDVDCRFTVCVFVFAVSCRGLVVGPARKFHVTGQAGACVPARVWCYWIRLSWEVTESVTK